MVAPEAIEGYLAVFEFSVPGFEAGGVLMFCNRGSYVFGLDSVEVEWFVVDDEVGVLGVGIERFGGAVYDEVFGLVYSGESWAWGDGRGWSEGVCGGCHSPGVYVQSL